MKANFYETLEEAPVKLPSERSTGLVLAGATFVAALVWGRSMPLTGAVAVVTGCVLAGLALFAPLLLRPVNVAWMGLAHLLGKLVSPLVMAILYFAAIVPFGLAAQACSDPLRRRKASDHESYWITPEVDFGPNDMTRQF